MIAAVTLDNRGSDKGQLRPMSERLAEAYGQRPGEHLADGGFVRLADIEALAATGAEYAVSRFDAGHGSLVVEETMRHAATEVAFARRACGV